MPLLRVNTLQSHRPETGRYSYGERGSHKEQFSFMAPWLLHAYLHASQAPLGLPCQKGLRGVSEHWRGGTIGHNSIHRDKASSLLDGKYLFDGPPGTGIPHKREVDASRPAMPLTSLSGYSYRITGDAVAARSRSQRFAAATAGIVCSRWARSTRKPGREHPACSRPSSCWTHSPC